ncbi:hypothetical protein PACTADRAFT_51622 [Pachysolen tannophilus NRRL Y-2460]|uniref:U3 small nucleolar RNA-associated protein 14 n=1 Tax=Pachysolen tannophilus NRRL Y-2460 TaxID=669874 RepID=A0A1E4TQ46_PACTA|nr:hypothetical protein PACTADRAFT_51622 [Pachysolen tannophilus NRRL Y-2460]
MAAKGNKTSRTKSKRRALDAFQLAEKAENRKKQQASDYASDEENDNFNSKKGILNAKKLMGNGHKGKEESGSESEFEDEEIDSDEALGSDDDYDVLDSRFSQTIRDKQKAKKRGEHISEDESDGEQSYDEGELMTLAEIWDLDDKEKAKKSSTQEKGFNKTNNDLVLDDDYGSEKSDSDESSEEEQDDEDEDDDDEDDEDDEEEVEEDDPFSEVSDNDDFQLKTVVDSLKDKSATKREKKRLVNLETEENFYNLPTNGKKLSLADMMAAVNSADSEKAILIDKEDSDNNKPLAVPLAQRIKQRHERKAGYEIQKEEVNKWQDTVKQNRRAEVLRFPMNPPVEHNEVSTFVPSKESVSELENKVNSVLEESALADTQKEATFEEIATAKLSSEELRKRQNELRLMRELMFREERRAKRIKKIKSKSYHKIKKKEILKNKELVEEDGSDDEEHDYKRAKERMSLKYKNRSNWAKSMIKSGMSKDAENREEMEEMLRQGERLKAKIMGRDENEDDEDSYNLSDLEKEKDGDLAEQQILRSKLGKGVMAMDFMKNAHEKERKENQIYLKELREFEANGGIDLEDFEKPANSINLEKSEGRRVYEPSANGKKQAVNKADEEFLKEIKIDESKSLANKLSTGKSNRSNGKLLSDKNEQNINNVDEHKEVSSNPWLTVDSGSKQKSKKIAIVDKNSNKLDKSQNKISKNKKRSATEADNEDTIIDMSETLHFVDAFCDPNDEKETEEDGSKIHMFKQKNLIKEAFAGDDVIKEFEAEKNQVIEDEGDKEVDLTLPGWGDWAGGNEKKKKRKIVKKIDGIIQKDKRKDKNMKNVIINEKVNKKNIKYQANGVPYPFETMEQYERSLRMPIGQEWTTREVHQKLTMPRIVAKHGTVIDPLKAPLT